MTETRPPAPTFEDPHRLEADGVAALVSRDGAELHSLADAEGRELLWQAGPAWPRRAPVLFPIVGKLAGDRLLHRGKSYRMTQHGFARDRRFDGSNAGALLAAWRCGMMLRPRGPTRSPSSSRSPTP